MKLEIRPCDDVPQLQAYIDAHWRKGHVLAHDSAMFDFTYRTPWVDRARFPAGVSVLGLYDGARMIGFLGAIVAPYPCPQSYWLALWHVLPDLKGGGWGGKLLQTMQSFAEDAGGWIGTFGAGPEAVPVYLKRGYCVRAARRWVFQPTEALRQPTASRADDMRQKSARPAVGGTAARQLSQSPLDLGEHAEWMEYRFRKHPRFSYESRAGGVSRTEENAWGTVTHVGWLPPDGWRADVEDVWRAGRERAARHTGQYLMDAWAFDCPGEGWSLAPEELPSVFHPPEARGNLIYAVGRPFIMPRVHKGDCDQDRPNGAETPAPTSARAAVS